MSVTENTVKNISDLGTESISTSSAISSLAKRVNECFGAITQLSSASSILSMDFIGAYNAVIRLCGDLKKLPSLFSNIKTEALKVFDSKLIKNFSKGVENGVNNAAKAFDNFGGYTQKVNDKFKVFAGNVKSFIPDMKDRISEFGDKAKIGFGKLENSIKGIPNKLANMKNGFKNLPATIETGMHGIGAKLSTSAASIGAAAGRLLTVGLIAGVVVAVAAIASLIAIFKYLMNTNEEFKEKVQAAWDKVKEAFQPAIDAFNRFKEAIFGVEGGEMTPFVQMILDGVTGIIDLIAGAVGFIADIIASIFEFLTGAWDENGVGLIDNIKAGWESVKEVFSTVFGFIAEVFGAIIATFSKIWDEHGQEVMSKVSELWNAVIGVISAAWEFIKGIIMAAFEIVKGFWDKHGEDIMAVIGNVWEFIVSIFSAGVSILTGVFDIIIGIFTLNGDKIKEGFSKIWEGIKEIFSGLGEFFGNLWEIVKSKFVGLGTKISEAISNAIKGAVNAVLTAIENKINNFFKMINNAISIVNNLTGLNIRYLQMIEIPKLAQGALVTPGQMFVAREAGPELVGSFGSKTAVMNNNQIVDSVSEGVYRAVLTAMKSNKNDQPLNITLQVGETQFGKVAVNAINSLARVQGKVKLAI